MKTEHKQMKALRRHKQIVKETNMHRHCRKGYVRESAIRAKPEAKKMHWLESLKQRLRRYWLAIVGKIKCKKLRPF